MTQLFQKERPIKLVELDRKVNASIEKEGEEQLEADVTSLSRDTLTPVTSSIKEEEEQIDLSNALGQLTGGSETTATDVIRELGVADENLPMKTILPSPGAFTAVQILADYNLMLGMENVTDALKEFAQWHYKHLCSHKGKRAEQQFGALTQVKQEEFQLEKEAKGLLHR